MKKVKFTYIIVDTIKSYIVARSTSLSHKFDIIKEYKTYMEAQDHINRITK